MHKPTKTNHQIRVQAFVKPDEQGRRMIELRDEEKKKRIMSAAPRSNRTEILSDYEMTIKAPNVKMIEPKILIRPGIAVTRDAWGEELPEEESEMCHDDLLEVKPASLKLSMAY